MNEDVAVNVHHIFKSFDLSGNKARSVKQMIVNIGKKQKQDRQVVLKNIDFKVNNGDFFGIVGRNGSGKSTLLKIIAGVYTPDSGAVETNGNLTPFIELGVGFNPELSGKDNVYLNAALLGYTRKQTKEIYDEIVRFAELEEHMDKKLKNYSSGMQVRLAFSIAIKVKSDVLIFDEVLAVGDEAFQRKCLDVFEQHKANKQTVILVTHDMETVKKFCNRAVLIDSGEIKEIGDPRKVANAYSKLNQAIINEALDADNKSHKENNFTTASIFNSQHKLKSNFEVGESLFLDLEWKDLSPDQIESIGVNIFKLSGEHVTGVNTRDSLKSAEWKKDGKLTLEFILNITPGKYRLVVEVFEKPGILIDSILTGLQFSINNAVVPWSGLINLSHNWYEK